MLGLPRSRAGPQLGREAVERQLDWEDAVKLFEGTSRVLLLGLGFALAVLFVPDAKASTIYLDFGCSGVANCDGIINSSDGNYSSTGITLTEGSGFYTPGSPFTLAFNSLAGTISLVGQGALSGQVFTGMMSDVSASTFHNTTDVNFGATWSALPADIQAYFGSTTGADSGFAIFLTGTAGGSATSVDLVITPAPEPASPLLLGAGLLALGLFTRRMTGSLA
jgi:hypothetical protein